MSFPFFVGGIDLFASFYYIDEEYIKYLQEKEIEYRGFTCVPNVIYANKEKFVFGVVMNMSVDNQMIPYFVPVTSYDKNQEDNILIKVKRNKQLVNVGSLRFNYMFPVPIRCAKQLDFRDKRYSNEYRLLLEQEYRYVKKAIKLVNIQKQAKKTYERVITGLDENLNKNSCAFSILEKAYLEYMERSSENT